MFEYGAKARLETLEMPEHIVNDTACVENGVDLGLMIPIKLEFQQR